MGWKTKTGKTDFYQLKGIAEKIFQLLGVQVNEFQMLENPRFEHALKAMVNGEVILEAGIIDKKILTRFDIKQPVFFADLNWQVISENKNKEATREESLVTPGYASIHVTEIPKFPAVQRDLAIILSGKINYKDVITSIRGTGLASLRNIQLFDIFESEKLGTGKKSIAISLTFLDEEKTLTDKEVDQWMNKIISAVEKDLNAEIRK